MELCLINKSILHNCFTFLSKYCVFIYTDKHTHLFFSIGQFIYFLYIHMFAYQMNDYILKE